MKTQPAIHPRGRSPRRAGRLFRCARRRRSGRDVQDDHHELGPSQRQVGSRARQGWHLQGVDEREHTRSRQVLGDRNDGHVRSRDRQRLFRSRRVRVEEVGEDGDFRPQAGDRLLPRTRSGAHSSVHTGAVGGRDDSPTLHRHGGRSRGQPPRRHVLGGHPRAAETACSPTATILESPRPSTLEAQAKAINDRGDIVGFADSNDGSGPIHAILWKNGKAADAVDLGVLPGYVTSEAYGVNNERVVLGLLFDRKERAVPFRWENGHMTVLRGPERAPPLHGESGCGRQECDQRPRRDDVDDDRGWRPTRSPLDSRRQGGLSSCPAGSHLDGCVQHQRQRRRVRLVAPLAEQGRCGEPRALDALGRGRPTADGAGPGRRDRRSDQPGGADRRIPRQPDGHRARERPVRGLAYAHGRAAASRASPAERDRRVRRRQRPRTGRGHDGHA